MYNLNNNIVWFDVDKRKKVRYYKQVVLRKQ